MLKWSKNISLLLEFQDSISNILRNYATKKWSNNVTKSSKRWKRKVLILLRKVPYCRCQIQVCLQFSNLKCLTTNLWEEVEMRIIKVRRQLLIRQLVLPRWLQSWEVQTHVRVCIHREWCETTRLLASFPRPLLTPNSKITAASHLW